MEWFIKLVVISTLTGAEVDSKILPGGMPLSECLGTEGRAAETQENYQVYLDGLGDNLKAKTECVLKGD